MTLVADVEPSEALRKELVAWVRKEIGPIAAPDVIQWAPGLPKTRSGKIMRRILRKIAANETDSLGDISTLADPGVVTELVENRAGKARGRGALSPRPVKSGDYPRSAAIPWRLGRQLIEPPHIKARQASGAGERRHDICRAFR